MRIYPAIDLKNGRCVRLRQGDPDQETVFSDDPIATAQAWERQGAEWLHVVDLDGAFGGNPQNAAAVSAIIESVSIPVQLGGGLRSMRHIATAFAVGVQRAIIGTAALENPSLVEEACRAFPDRIAVGIDARDGFVATRGWRVVTEAPATDLARRMEEYGVCRIIYTDISRDGMLEGPNLDAVRRLAGRLTIPVIASGGVSSLEDLRALREVEEAGVEGVIVGLALYAGAFTLAEAIQTAR